MGIVQVSITAAIIPRPVTNNNNQDCRNLHVARVMIVRSGVDVSWCADTLVESAIASISYSSFFLFGTELIYGRVSNLMHGFVTGYGTDYNRIDSNYTDECLFCQAWNLVEFFTNVGAALTTSRNHHGFTWASSTRPLRDLGLFWQ